MLDERFENALAAPQKRGTNRNHAKVENAQSHVETNQGDGQRQTHAHATRQKPFSSKEARARESVVYRNDRSARRGRYQTHSKTCAVFEEQVEEDHGKS